MKVTIVVVFCSFILAVADSKELESKMWQALFSSTFSNGVERYMVQLLDNNNAIKCTGIFYNRNHFVTGQKCFSEWLANRGGIIYVPNYPDIDHRTQQINRIKSTFVDIEVNIGNGQESIGSVLIVQVQNSLCDGSVNGLDSPLELFNYNQFEITEFVTAAGWNDNQQFDMKTGVISGANDNSFIVIHSASTDRKYTSRPGDPLFFMNRLIGILLEKSRTCHLTAFYYRFSVPEIDHLLTL